MTPAAPAVRYDRRDRVLAMTGVMLALLLAALDQTIVAAAGPAIQRALRIPTALYGWITTAYLVASTVMLPIYGKLSDRLGRRPILLTGVVLFLAGSLLCGVAPTALALIAFRAVQGLGAAALFTSTFAVIGDLFPPAERGKYMGLIGGVMGVASVVGPLVGGVLTDRLGWHWIFFVNLPIGAVALWFILTRMPPLPGVHRDGARPPIDVAGAVALVVGVVPLLVALSLGRGAPGTGAWRLPALLAVAVVALAAFVRIERRAADPIVHFELFSDRVIGLSTATVFVLGFSFLFSVVFLPLFLVNVVGVSATKAGLTMVPLTLGMVTGSVLSGQIVARVGRYKALLLGSLAVLVGAFAYLGWTLQPDTTQREVTLGMVLVGLGMGPSLPLFTLVAQNAARPEQLGVVTGAVTFARSLGQVLGVAVFGMLFSATLAGSMSTSSAAAVATLPAHLRPLVAATGAGVHPEEEGARIAAAFDPAAARARVDAQPTLTAPERAAAAGAIARVDAAVGQAYADAVSRLYQVGMLVVLAGLALTALTPERELRAHHPRTSAPVRLVE